MSRPTDFKLPKGTQLTPAPQEYDLKVTNMGHTLLTKTGSPNIQEQVRGTLSRESRFREYKYNAFIRSNPMVGPGSHSDMENFKQLKQKPCKVVMSNQFYRSRDFQRSRSNDSIKKSRSRSGGSVKIHSRKNSALDEMQQRGGRVSSSKSRSKSPAVRFNTRKLDTQSGKNEEQYIATGNLLLKSPLKNDVGVDDRINFEIYKQDSMDHRQHLLNVIKKKSLKKERKRIAVSYRPSGQQGFKVGFTGKLQDIYKSNVDTHLIKVNEERQRSREKRRKSMYKELYGPGYGSKAIIKAVTEIPKSKMRNVEKELDAQIKSVEKMNRDKSQQSQENTQELMNITLDPLKTAEFSGKNISPVKQTFQSSTMIGSKVDQNLDLKGQDALNQVDSSRVQTNAQGIAFTGSINSSINSNMYKPVLNMGQRAQKSSQKRLTYTAQQNEISSYGDQMPEAQQKPPIGHGRVRPKSAKNKGAIRSSSILNSKQRPASGKVNMRGNNNTVSIYKDTETNQSNAQFVILEEEDRLNELDSNRQNVQEYNQAQSKQNEMGTNSGAVHHSFQVLEDEAKNVMVGNTRRKKRLQSAKVRPENPQNQSLVYNQNGSKETGYFSAMKGTGDRRAPKRRQRPASGQPDIATMRYAQAARQQAAFQKSKILANSVHQSTGFNNIGQEGAPSSITEYLVHPDQHISPDLQSNQFIRSENTRSSQNMKVVPSYNHRERMQNYQPEKAFQYYRQTFVQPGQQKYSINEQIQNVAKNAEIQYQKQLKAIQNQKSQSAKSFHTKFSSTGPVKVMPEKALESFANYQQNEQNLKRAIGQQSSKEMLPKHKIRAPSRNRRNKHGHSSSLQLSMAQIYDPFVNPVPIVKQAPKKRRRLVPRPPKQPFSHNQQVQINQHYQQLDNLQEEDQAKEADTLLHDRQVQPDVRRDSTQDLFQGNKSIQPPTNFTGISNIADPEAQEQVQLQDLPYGEIEINQEQYQSEQQSLPSQQAVLIQQQIEQSLPNGDLEYQMESLPSQQAQFIENEHEVYPKLDAEQATLDSQQLEEKMRAREMQNNQMLSKNESVTFNQLSNEAQNRMQSMQKSKQSSAEEHNTNQYLGLLDPSDFAHRSSLQQSQGERSGFQTFELNQQQENLTDKSLKSSNRYLKNNKKPVQQPSITQQNETIQQQSQDSKNTQDAQIVMKDGEMSPEQEQSSQQQHTETKKEIERELTERSQRNSQKEEQSQGYMQSQPTLEQAQISNQDLQQVIQSAQMYDKLKTLSDEQQASFSIPVHKSKSKNTIAQEDSLKSNPLIEPESKQTIDGGMPHYLGQDSQSAVQKEDPETPKKSQNSPNRIHQNPNDKNTSRTNHDENISQPYQIGLEQQSKDMNTINSVELQKAQNTIEFKNSQGNVQSLVFHEQPHLRDSSQNHSSIPTSSNNLPQSGQNPYDPIDQQSSIQIVQNNTNSDEVQTKQYSNDFVQDPIIKKQDQQSLQQQQLLQESSDTQRKSQVTNNVHHDGKVVVVSNSIDVDRMNVNTNEKILASRGNASSRKNISHKKFLEDQSDEYASEQQEQAQKQQPPGSQKVFSNSIANDSVNQNNEMEQQQSVNYSYYSESQQSQSIKIEPRESKPLGAQNGDSRQTPLIAPIVPKIKIDPKEQSYTEKSIEQQQDIDSKEIKSLSKDWSLLAGKQEIKEDRSGSLSGSRHSNKDFDITQEEGEDEDEEYGYYDEGQINWYYNAGNSNTIHWVAYDEEESDIIEKYYQEKVKSFQIKFGGQNLVFDLKKNLQYQQNDMSKSKAIKRMMA